MVLIEPALILAPLVGSPPSEPPSPMTLIGITPALNSDGLFPANHTERGPAWASAFLGRYWAFGKDLLKSRVRGNLFAAASVQADPMGTCCS